MLEENIDMISYFLSVGYHFKDNIKQKKNPKGKIDDNKIDMQLIKHTRK